MKTGYDRFFQVSKKRVSSGRNPQRPAATIPKSAPQPGQRVSTVSGSRVRSRRGVPWLAFLLIGTVSCILGWFFENPESLRAALSHANSISISIFGQAVAKEEGKKIPDAQVSAEKKSGAEAVVADAEPEKKKSWTEEEVSLFRHLEARKKELDQKEETLKKLEEELQKQKDEVAVRLQQLEETRKKISGQLESKVQTDLERVEKLVSFYSNMKPQSAAKVFQELNEDLVVELLQKMKQKNAADIMNLLPSEKAQKLTERFAGYRRN